MACILHGRRVPPIDYETLRRLEHIAFGLTPAGTTERSAHAVATDCAVIMLEQMRAYVRARRSDLVFTKE